MKSLVLILATFFIATLHSAFSQVETGRSGQEVLKRQVSMPFLGDNETPSVFQRALLRSKLPGGMVLVNCGDKRTQHSLSGIDTTMDNLLDFLVQNDPEYSWELNSGALNLLPRNGIPALLETQIGEFDVNGVTPDEALSSLLKKTETRQKMDELGLDKSVAFFSKLGYFDPNAKPDVRFRFHLNLKNITFRQVLNEIVKAHGELSWVYTEKRCGKLNFSIVLNG